MANFLSDALEREHEKLLANHNVVPVYENGLGKETAKPDHSRVKLDQFHSAILEQEKNHKVNEIPAPKLKAPEFKKKGNYGENFDEYRLHSTIKPVILGENESEKAESKPMQEVIFVKSPDEIKEHVGRILVVDKHEELIEKNAIKPVYVPITTKDFEQGLPKLVPQSSALVEIKDLSELDLPSVFYSEDEIARVLIKTEDYDFLDRYKNDITGVSFIMAPSIAEISPYLATVPDSQVDYKKEIEPYLATVPESAYEDPTNTDKSPYGVMSGAREGSEIGLDNGIEKVYEGYGEGGVNVDIYGNISDFTSFNTGLRDSVKGRDLNNKITTFEKYPTYGQADAEPDKVVSKSEYKGPINTEKDPYKFTTCFGTFTLDVKPITGLDTGIDSAYEQTYSKDLTKDQKIGPGDNSENILKASKLSSAANKQRLEHEWGMSCDVIGSVYKDAQGFTDSPTKLRSDQTLPTTNHNPSITQTRYTSKGKEQCKNDVLSSFGNYSVIGGYDNLSTQIQQQAYSGIDKAYSEYGVGPVREPSPDKLNPSSVVCSAEYNGETYDNQEPYKVLSHTGNWTYDDYNIEGVDTGIYNAYATTYSVQCQDTFSYSSKLKTDNRLTRQCGSKYITTKWSKDDKDALWSVYGTFTIDTCEITGVNTRIQNAYAYYSASCLDNQTVSCLKNTGKLLNGRYITKSRLNYLGKNSLYLTERSGFYYNEEGDVVSTPDDIDRGGGFTTHIEGVYSDYGKPIKKMEIPRETDLTRFSSRGFSRTATLTQQSVGYIDEAGVLQTRSFLGLKDPDDSSEYSYERDVSAALNIMNQGFSAGALGKLGHITSFTRTQLDRVTSPSLMVKGTMLTSSSSAAEVANTVLTGASFKTLWDPLKSIATWTAYSLIPYHWLYMPRFSLLAVGGVVDFNTIARRFNIDKLLNMLEKLPPKVKNFSVRLSFPSSFSGIGETAFLSKYGPINYLQVIEGKTIGMPVFTDWMGGPYYTKTSHNYRMYFTEGTNTNADYEQATRTHDQKSYLNTRLNGTDSQSLEFRGHFTQIRDSHYTNDTAVANFGTEFYWDMLFSYPKGNEKHLPQFPYSGWMPVQSYSLTGTSTGTMTVPTLAGDITVPDMYKLPTTISITIPETSWMSVDNWLRAYFAAIFCGESKPNQQLSTGMPQLRILPYKQQTLYITIYWMNEQWIVLRKKTFICIPDLKFSYQGQSSKELKTHDIQFNIVGTKGLSQVDFTSANGTESNYITMLE